MLLEDYILKMGLVEDVQRGYMLALNQDIAGYIHILLVGKRRRCEQRHEIRYEIQHGRGIVVKESSAVERPQNVGGSPQRRPVRPLSSVTVAGLAKPGVNNAASGSQGVESNNRVG